MIRMSTASISSCVRKIGAIVLLVMATFVFSEKVTLPNLEELLVVNKPLQHADALVVMAGEVPVRLPAAAKLYFNGKGDKILLTNDGVLGGWSEKKQRNLYQVEWAEEELLRMKIPENALVKLTYTSSGSIHDALNTRTAVMNLGIRSIIVVTSEYHTRRTLWVFEKVFRGCAVDIGVYPVKSKLESMTFSKKTFVLIIEFLKYVYYKYAYSRI